MPERSLPKRMPQEWVPPAVPAYSAVIAGRTTIAYYGVQSPRGPEAPVVRGFREWITAAVSESDGPDHTEWAEFEDVTGAYTWLAISYWIDDQPRFERWSAGAAHAAYWDDEQRLAGVGGVFREVFHCPTGRIESLVSHPSIQAGIAAAIPERTDEIAEHTYWGSMRDRLVVAGYDPLDPELTELPAPASAEAGSGRRVRVPGIGNIAVIRSGQLTGDLEGDERAFYEKRVNPALEGGMRYLRDHPVESGCISCRYLQETTSDGSPLSRTFGLATFTSLQKLEIWAAQHPSHLRIFTEFLEMSERLGGDIRLRLWHEVAVLEPGDQLFEYLNCHSRTGMLAAGVEATPTKGTI